jgi:eukaryotic-like serine/threonine-protein kinase
VPGCSGRWPIRTAGGQQACSGGLGSTFALDCFVHERQILASLGHPNIERLLDGGATENGVPYLVMELIEGDRIDAYCQARRPSITERLRMFLQTCAAVQHAH